MPPLNDPRYFHAMCSIKGGEHIYIFCGKNQFENFLRSIEHYSRDNQYRWQHITLSFPTPYPYCIYGLAVHPMNDSEILVLGQAGFPKHIKQ